MAIPYFIITAILGFVAKLVPNAKNDEYGELTSKRKSVNAKTGFIIVCIILILFSAFRDLHAVGNDEYAYRNRYDSFSRQSLSQVLSNDESGAPILTTIFWLSTRITTTNQGGIMVTAFLTVLLILLSLRRDAKDFSYAIIMLMATAYFFNTFNGIAQCLAAAVALYSFKYVYDKKPYKFFFAVLICCMIHTASVILFLLYFICNTKLGSGKMYLWDMAFLAGAIILYRMLPTIIPQFNILTDYQEAVTQGHHGVNILTIIISIAPAIIALVIAPQIDQNDRVTTVTAHMTIINALIYIAGSMDVYIARFALFTDIFVVIFLSRVFKYFNDKHGLLKPLTVVLYSLVALYRMGSAHYSFNFVW